mmetsp:Transcript_44661/g.97532  ORF Transcript_44661/g.97532 Transcript_44661/m.97532 type:complete len:304 (+) Transcript_44661:1394-2305(+)
MPMKWCCVVAFSKTSCISMGMPLFGRVDLAMRPMIASDIFSNFSIVSLFSAARMSRTKTSSTTASSSVGFSCRTSCFHFLVIAAQDVSLTCKGASFCRDPPPPFLPRASSPRLSEDRRCASRHSAFGFGFGFSSCSANLVAHAGVAPPTCVASSVCQRGRPLSAGSSSCSSSHSRAFISVLMSYECASTFSSTVPLAVGFLSTEAGGDTLTGTAGGLACTSASEARSEVTNSPARGLSRAMSSRASSEYSASWPSASSMLRPPDRRRCWKTAATDCALRQSSSPRLSSQSDTLGSASSLCWAQ